MTPQQVADRAQALADQVLAVDMVDWTGWSQAEQGNCLHLCLYILRQRRSRRPQRRAMRLLRTWLPAAQQAQLRSCGYFHVRGSAGGHYRVLPLTGTTHRLEQHGTRWFARWGYCLHPDAWVPAADVALGHYLLLVTDEPAFLALANERPLGRQLWDGAYLRRLRQTRAQREAAA